MKKSAERNQMTSDMKKPSSPKPIRVMDERDPMWSSLNNLTVGMTPQERAEYLIKFVESLTKKKNKASKE
jgi:hypothetical protein